MRTSQTIEVSRVTSDQVWGWIERDEPVLFVDGRDEQSWKHSDVKLPGAVRVEPGQASDHVVEIPPGRSIITYCTSHRDEAAAGVAQELLRLGYDDVHVLDGGFEAWKRSGGTLEHRSAAR
jgi:rhodanese-related sulfurtransferase